MMMLTAEWRSNGRDYMSEGKRTKYSKALTGPDEPKPLAEPPMSGVSGYYSKVLVRAPASYFIAYMAIRYSYSYQFPIRHPSSPVSAARKRRPELLYTPTCRYAKSLRALQKRLARPAELQQSMLWLHPNQRLFRKSAVLGVLGCVSAELLELGALHRPSALLRTHRTSRGAGIQDTLDCGVTLEVV